NRANQEDVTQSCSYKTFRSCGAKEFFGTEGAVGLLTWFEGIKAVLHIRKCPAESQVEFASYLKKLLMEEYCPDDEIQKLESKFWNLKMSDVCMANRLTTDGINDGIFKKKENARNKKRSNDQNKNRGGMIGTRDKELEGTLL
ncbi:hypothetical protein Tco_0049424, partial [Tanacetum coccineum]